MSRATNSAGLPDLTGAYWLTRPETRRVFDALCSEGAEVRAVGGAVRNALIGTPVNDVDIATTALPKEVMMLAKQAGLHAVPTGIEHGTVTVISGHVPFEVTTLRRDIETFGRHARVTFTTDWSEDALRRDFTMNALYCDGDGTVYDPIGGYPDLMARRVRFIGDARARIQEDYLRILRFFRFNAEYAAGTAPDPEGLAASIAERDGLAGLSGERVRAELLRLLAAPGAVSAARIMADAGLMPELIGHIDLERLARLAAIEDALGREPDPVLRLAALAVDEPGDVARLRDRLRLSAAETARLAHTVVHSEAFEPSANERAAQAFVFRHGVENFSDGMMMAWARSTATPHDAARAARLALPQRWQAPELPLRGADVLALGVPAGPAVGKIMAAFESWWIETGFPAEKDKAAAKLRELVRDHLSGNDGP